MANFSIVANNLCGLTMYKQTSDSSLHLKPVVIEMSDLKYAGDDYYEYKIKIIVSKYFDESEETLYMELIFTPFIHVASGEDLETILNEFVPHRLFNNTRVLVWALSSEASMPLMLEDDAWRDPEVLYLQNDANLLNEQNGSVSKRQKEALKEIVTNFKGLTSYNYYYQLITPVAYEHPDFEECDEDVWTVLFQLLFGSFDMDCHLDNRYDGRLELCYCDADGRGGRVSNLTLYELDILIVRLWTSFWEDILPFMKHENLNQEVEFENEEGNLISKEDFFSLYRIEESDLDGSLSLMLEKMYDRIVRCDAESFPYRC